MVEMGVMNDGGITQNKKTVAVARADVGFINLHHPLPSHRSPFFREIGR
jgi:hypothetical protein